MKTLTLTISDEAAEELAKAAAADGKHSAEELAAHIVEEAMDADWWEALDSEERAAIDEGYAQAKRGEFATDKEVEEAFARFRK